MAMNFKRRLPIPMEIREEMPLGPELVEKKKAFDAEVARIFAGEDARKVLIIGPCSADREDSVLEYAVRLGNLAQEVKDKLLIISGRSARRRQGDPPYAPARDSGIRDVHRR